MTTTRRNILQAVAAGICWTSVCCGLTHAQSRTSSPCFPQTTHDSDLLLFVDDHWIAEQQGLRRVVNHAQPQSEPIIWPDDPRTETDCAWGNVIREQDGRFRLWYCTMTMGHNAGGPHEMAAAKVWGKGDDYAFPSGGGDRLLIVPDQRHRRWMAYVRAGGWSYPTFSYGSDLVKWSEADPAPQITPKDVQAPAVECMIPFNYGNQDLGFPCGMDKPKGVFTVMLATRHDGTPWSWVENQQPFIPFGPPDSYYSTGAVPLHNEPFIVGDELLIFFNAFSRNQATASRFGNRSIGVAKLRRDGFAGLTAMNNGKPGTLTTRPIMLKGDMLLLNVEQRSGQGQAEVAILSETGDCLRHAL